MGVSLCFMGECMQDVRLRGEPLVSEMLVLRKDK